MRLTNAIEIDYPIVQAPMAGVTTPSFVAACSEAGVLGSIGAGYLTAVETSHFIRAVQTITSQPFAVNLFVPEQPERDEKVIQSAYEALRPVAQQLGLEDWTYTLSDEAFDEQIDVVIEEGVKVCSFTFGLPTKEQLQRLKAADVYTIGTATTLKEAMLAEQLGLDAVVAQGSEAGGHRGSFDGDLQLIPLATLLADIVQTVNIPVIAAGGIATKEQMEDYLKQGALAVQIGTALLATAESGAHPLYKQSVLEAKQGATALTKAFSGKYARGIENQLMQMMKEATIAPYPIQNDLTKKLRAEAAKQEKTGFMSMWAGESVHLSKEGTVREVIQSFF